MANLEEAKSNIHLKELSTQREQEDAVTDRTVRDVLESRSPLYAEAAELLQRYRRLRNHKVDPSGAKNLLRRRLFGPAPGENWSEDDAPVFFELYWIFNLLRGYDAARRNLITKGTHQIASWKDGKSRYELYHDWDGGTEFAFGESYFDRERDRAVAGESRYLGRTSELLTMQEREVKGVFGLQRKRSKSRRPDFVLIRRKGDSVCDIAIGEVKYTRNQQTAADGLEELYRYMIFARESTRSKPAYFTSGPGHFETPNVHGYLCLDKIDLEREPNGNISVVEVGGTVEAPF